jgi:hypothetical protein
MTALDAGDTGGADIGWLHLHRLMPRRGLMGW